jgi:hypothetical protein
MWNLVPYGVDLILKMLLKKNYRVLCHKQLELLQFTRHSSNLQVFIIPTLTGTHALDMLCQ